MSPAHVFEPTYEALKRRLMAGVWGAGQRLEAARLADELGVSMTPVRDSLARLAAERLVDFAHGEGFRVPRVSEAELRDLFELKLILLLAALAGGETAATVDTAAAEGPFGRDAAELVVTRLTANVMAIARRSGNAELVLTVQSIADRLHLAHLHMAGILPGFEAACDDLEAARIAGSPKALRALLMRHQALGADQSAALVRMMDTPRGS